MRNPEDLKKEILGNENGLILEGSISGMFIRPNKKSYNWPDLNLFENIDTTLLLFFQYNFAVVLDFWTFQGKHNIYTLSVK